MSRTFVREWKPLIGVCPLCFGPDATVTVSAPTPGVTPMVRLPSARLGYLDEVCEECQERGIGLIVDSHTGAGPDRSVCPHCGRVADR